MTFTDFLKNKCREERFCTKDNWQETWEFFLDDLLDIENKLDELAEQWRIQENTAIRGLRPNKIIMDEFKNKNLIK